MNWRTTLFLFIVQNTRICYIFNSYDLEWFLKYVSCSRSIFFFLFFPFKFVCECVCVCGFCSVCLNSLNLLTLKLCCCCCFYHIISLFFKYMFRLNVLKLKMNSSRIADQSFFVSLNCKCRSWLLFFSILNTILADDSKNDSVAFLFSFINTDFRLEFYAFHGSDIDYTFSSP